MLEVSLFFSHAEEGEGALRVYVVTSVQPCILPNTRLLVRPHQDVLLLGRSLLEPAHETLAHHVRRLLNLPLPVLPLLDLPLVRLPLL